MQHDFQVQLLRPDHSARLNWTQLVQLSWVGSGAMITPPTRLNST